MPKTMIKIRYQKSGQNPRTTDRTIPDRRAGQPCTNLSFLPCINNFMSSFICLIISLDSETSSIIFYSLRMTHFLLCDLSESPIRSRWASEKVSHWWLIALWWFIKIAILYRRERKKPKSERKLKWRFSLRYSPWHRLAQSSPDLSAFTPFAIDYYIWIFPPMHLLSNPRKLVLNFSEFSVFRVMR